jgi:putative ABC transport system substrate-binding protein
MMKRRDFITLLGGAAATWPLAARAQQPAMPVVGLLDSNSSDRLAPPVVAFRQGLGESGFVEGRNVAIEYRLSDGRYDRLEALAADLASRQVAVIVAAGNAAAVAAKAATPRIPIVFFAGFDPVAVGLVASLSRPGGNVTGVTSLNTELGSKRLELLHEVLPAATVIPLLINPINPNAQTLLKDAQASARSLGLELHILNAASEQEFNTAFATLAQLRARGLVIGPDIFFNARSKRLAELSLQQSIAAIYQNREFAAAGGLMSYGGSFTELYRLVGIYAGRILKGDNSADLPVQQSTKVELIINLKTAKTLGLTVPQTLLYRADEVIE